MAGTHREDVARGRGPSRPQLVFFAGTDPQLAVLVEAIDNGEGRVLAYYRHVGDPDPMLTIDMDDAAREVEADLGERMESVLLSLEPITRAELLVEGRAFNAREIRRARGNF